MFVCTSEERARRKSFSSFGLKLNFLLKKLMLARLRRSLASFLASDVNDEASKHKPRLKFASFDQSLARGVDSGVGRFGNPSPPATLALQSFGSSWNGVFSIRTWLDYRRGRWTAAASYFPFGISFCPFRLQGEASPPTFRKREKSNQKFN